MGALAATGCAWRPWLHATQLGATGTARPMGAFSMGVRVDWGLSQRPVRIDCGLSYTTGQATIALSRLWLVYFNLNSSTLSVVALPM